MRSKKPVIYHNDGNVNETFDSISWAEKEYGRMMKDESTDFALLAEEVMGKKKNYDINLS